LFIASLYRRLSTNLTQRNAAVLSQLKAAQQERRDPTRLRRNEKEVRPARA
jgi:hypothetical protein